MLFEDDMTEMDLDFLQIGFVDIRKASWEELITKRKAWVECRGLPIGAWMEKNFKKILAPWGKILRYNSMTDEEECFQTPKFLLEIENGDSIEASIQVKIKDKIWEVKIKESEGGTCDCIRDNLLQKEAEFTKQDGYTSGASNIDSNITGTGCENIDQEGDGETRIPKEEFGNIYQEGDGKEEI